METETLILARSAIRDLVNGWDARELAENPVKIVARLTALIGDKYDFDSGESK